MLRPLPGATARPMAEMPLYPWKGFLWCSSSWVFLCLWCQQLLIFVSMGHRTQAPTKDASLTFNTSDSKSGWFSDFLQSVLWILPFIYETSPLWHLSSSCSHLSHPGVSKCYWDKWCRSLKVKWSPKYKIINMPQSPAMHPVPIFQISAWAPMFYCR